MSKNGKRRGRAHSWIRQLPLPLHGPAREALWDTAVISGLAFLEKELEVERVALCGRVNQHHLARQALRFGHAPISLI